MLSCSFAVFSFCFLLFDVTVAQSGRNCVTPNGENAKCISIYSCKILYDAVTTSDQNVVRFLKASQCGYDQNPLVCCGTSATYTGTAPVVTPTDSTSTTNPENHRNYNLLSNRKICGYQSYEDKILNGETAGLSEYPWMALLRYKNGSGFEQFSCGGTLINNKYIVTAAHCVIGEIITKIGTLQLARLGEWNTQTEKDCFTSLGFQSCSDPPVDVEVEQAIPHPDYNTRDVNRYHDIALIRLKRSVPFTEYIRPICLPLTTEKAAVGERPVVAGWGLTENRVYSPTKQKLKVPVVAPTNCAAKFREFGVTLRDSQICAGGETGKDSCKGDSGGPLLHTSPIAKSQHYLEGVVSFGLNCGNAGWPGIYTRVSSYMPWILDNLRP